MIVYQQVILKFFLIIIFGSFIVLCKGQIINISDVDVVGVKTATSGKSISILDRQEISEMPVNSVDELLRYIPGLNIQSRGGFGAQSDITLRGSTFNQVLIMVDGVRINDPMTGHFNGYIPVALAEIERVEVVRGAAASVYGVDAVGGVINIVTQYNTSKIERMASAEIKAGSNDYLGLETVITGVDSSGWFFGGSFQMNQSSGETFFNPNALILSQAPSDYNTGFDLKTAALTVGKQLSNQWKMYLRSSYDDRSFDAKYFYTASVYDESVEETKIFFNQLKIQRTGEKAKTVIDVAHRYGEDLFTFNPIFPSNKSRTQYYLAQLNHFYFWKKNIQINSGFQTDLRKVFSIDRGNHENLHSAVFGLINYLPRPNILINVGVRGDYEESYGLQINPHLNAQWELNKFVIRGSINRAVRAPDYTEQYVSNGLVSLSPLRNLGNPDLEAETSLNADIGIDYLFSNKQKFSLNYFSRYSKNLIDYVLTSGNEITSNVMLDPTANYLYSQNIASVVTNGVELVWDGQIELGEKTKLRTNIGYTWLETLKESKFWSSGDSDSEFELTKYISSHPKHMINGALFLDYERVSIGVSGIWKNRITTFSDDLGFPSKTDYLVMDANISLRIGSYGSIGFEVRNIGDVQVQDVYGAVLPGRWLIGSLKIKV